MRKLKLHQAESSNGRQRISYATVQTGGTENEIHISRCKGGPIRSVCYGDLHKCRWHLTVTVKGYVLDSACAFTKGLSKPISKQCATSCANAGSQLVILTDNGTIYWPIVDTTPSSGQNPKLLPFAGDKVIVRGKVYQRGGSRAIVIEKIEAQTSRK